MPYLRLCLLPGSPHQGVLEAGSSQSRNSDTTPFRQIGNHCSRSAGEATEAGAFPMLCSWAGRKAEHTPLGLLGTAPPACPQGSWPPGSI